MNEPDADRLELLDRIAERVPELTSPRTWSSGRRSTTATRR
jgi:hypothetical protein